MKYGTLTVLLAVVALCGCQGPERRTFDDVDCPGKATIGEAVRMLSLQKQNVQPLEVVADCTISWREADGKKPDENVPGKLLFMPPDKLLFRGNKFGKVQFGTNETEFWLLVEPELDTYWWGSKDQADQCAETMLINPTNIAEALGIVDVTTDWKLSHRGNYDILELIEDGKKVKRVYINTCDYHIEEIEYFDADGFKKVSIKLSDYTLGENNGIVVPSRIWAGYYDKQGIDESSVEIDLKQVRVLLPKKQKKKLFVRPSWDGYKDVFRLNEQCEFELIK